MEWSIKRLTTEEHSFALIRGQEIQRFGEQTSYLKSV